MSEVPLQVHERIWGSSRRICVGVDFSMRVDFSRGKGLVTCSRAFRLPSSTSESFSRTSAHTCKVDPST